MEIAPAYAAARTRLLDLAAMLSDEEAAKPVPACPEWVVKDVYAHLAGVVADSMAGRLDGVATDPWTAVQVEARRDRSLAEICIEWSDSAELFDLGLAARGDSIDPRLLMDIWTHEQDVRGAVGRPGARDIDVVQFAVATMLRGMRAGWPARGLPTLRVVTSTSDVTLADSAPAATLRTTDFEFARLVLGRRTPAQVAALDWDGDPTPFAEHLHVFGPAREPVIE